MFEMVKQVNAILKVYLCFKIKLFSVSVFMELINSIPYVTVRNLLRRNLFKLAKLKLQLKKTIALYLGFFLMHPNYFKNDQVNQHYLISLLMFPNKVVYLSLFIKLFMVFMY